MTPRATRDGRPPGTARGVGRSLRIYYGDPARAAAMDRLYRPFVPSGGLVFDIGAHVGDRIASFRRLGARVVALEPQPGPFRALCLIHGRDRGVTLIETAVGAASGQTTLRINTANPTISTASDAFVRAATGARGWRGQSWPATIARAVVALDTLIARHGCPDFIKIDVEGWEHQVLRGLSAPVPALSFEVTTIQRDVARACVRRMAALGPYRFRLALGESQRFEGDGWDSASQMAARLAALPDRANSGDVYAVLDPQGAG